MVRTIEIPDGFFFKGQLLHAVLLVGLLVVALLLVDFQQLHDSEWFGVTSYVWFLIALATPIVHQLYVWLVWRSELCFGAVTRRFGRRGFLVYQAVFMVLLLCRPLSFLLLAISDHDTLAIGVPARVLMSVVLVVPALYTLYSVVRYFGITRAVGGDHFDPNYRDLPMVREGIFRFTSNAMYGVAFLLLWAVAIAFASRAALVVAMFSHAYIWVHYYCTERPDMRLIYGNRSQVSRELTANER